MSSAFFTSSVFKAMVAHAILPGYPFFLKAIPQPLLQTHRHIQRQVQDAVFFHNVFGIEDDPQQKSKEKAPAKAIVQHAGPAMDAVHRQHK